MRKIGWQMGFKTSRFLVYEYLKWNDGGGISDMTEEIEKLTISEDASIREALKKINDTARAILFVCDKDNSLLGSLTDGDIRRGILSDGDIHGNIKDCFNHNPIFVIENDYGNNDVKRLMLDKTIEVIPIVDKDRKIKDIIFWRDIFGDGFINHRKVNVPVVIMAGGKGERLGSFTKIFPKSLIPIGEKPIIELIIDKFREFGINNFYITLNYKGEMIQMYLESLQKDYEIRYVWEEEFLGTAGSLKLIEEFLTDNFIVSNSDIMVDLNYKDLVDFHNSNKNCLTVVGSIQHYRVSYGVVDFEKNGKIKQIREKPEFDFTINTGVYVLRKEVIDLIPDGRRFDMNELINTLLENSKKVGVYPVSQKSYIDVGQWEEYKKAIENLHLFK